jgi:NAD-dependent protein deacetylase/lipoamidase
VTAVEDIAGWIRAAKKVVVLTGAGISTESGIPDFRGPQGVWTKDPEAEKMSHIHYYMNDPEIRVRAWRMRVEHPAFSATPNKGHLALADLERKGKLDLLVTQNVDGLHLAAGNSPDRVVEIHGTVREVVCMSCGERAPMERALQRVREGEEDPPCRTCGGILKSATVSFGQALDADDVERSAKVTETCDLFLAIGTSLTVYPVAGLPRIALETGAQLAILNAEETPYDGIAHAVLNERLGDVLPRIVALI